MHVHVLGCMRVCVLTCMHVCTVTEWQCGNEGGCQGTGWHWCAVTVDLLKVWSASSHVSSGQLSRPSRTPQLHVTQRHLCMYFFTVHLVCLWRSPTEVIDLLFLGWPIQERALNEQHGAMCKKPITSHMGEKVSWVNMSCDTYHFPSLFLHCLFLPLLLCHITILF